MNSNYNFLMKELDLNQHQLNSLLDSKYDRAEFQLVEFVKLAKSNGLETGDVLNLLSEPFGPIDPRYTICSHLTNSDVNTDQMKDVILAYARNMGGCI